MKISGGFIRRTFFIILFIANSLTADAQNILRTIPINKDNVSIQFRLVDEECKDNTTSYIKILDGEEYYLHDEILLDENYILSIQEVSDVAGRLFIIINFSEPGIEQFYKITKSNIDKWMGILIDGELVLTAIITEAINSDSVRISGFSKGEISDIVRTIPATEK